MIIFISYITFLFN